MRKLQMASLCAVIFSSAGAHAQQQSITVGVYGGIAQRAITECVFKPFSDRTGVRVIADAGASAVTLNKLISQKNAPAMDVAYMDGGVSEQALSAGVLEFMDPARIPNVNNLLDQGRYQDGGKTYAASNGFYSFGILYSKKLVKTKPTSWKDLAKPEYSNLVALPNPHVSMGLPMLLHMSVIQGGSVVNVDPGLDHIRKIKPVAFYNSAGTVSSMFQSEEIGIAPHFSTSAWELIKAGAPLEFVVPTDKGIGNDFRIHLVKGAPKRSLAEQLINQSLTPAAAECLADKFNAGPPLKGIKLKPEVARYMPWGEKGSIANLSIPDWRMINAKREALVKRFEVETRR